VDVFLAIHDPTQLNRQGNDLGSQYRSGIYFHTPEQGEVALAKLAAVNDKMGVRVSPAPQSQSRLWRDRLCVTRHGAVLLGHHVLMAKA
jgi:peptide-methionine (S)-S-oxide reductase